MATFAQLFYPALSGLQFDGVALNGGLLYFYEPGTTTFRTIYTNRTKTVTAANPYTLDPNGQAELFLDGVYDVVAKTSGGTTKATWENYEAGFTLDGFTASTTPTANQIPALNSSSVLTLPNAVHVINGNKIWHAGNDGAASGLNADKLDDQEGAYYASLASPTFTGVPAAPTAAAGTNTTQVATTAFTLKNSISGFAYAATPTALTVISTIVPQDDTIPQTSETTGVASIVYTAKNSNSLLRIRYNASGVGDNGNGHWLIGLFKDADASATHVDWGRIADSEASRFSFEHVFVVGDTSSHTYTIRMGSVAAGQVVINGTGAIPAHVFGAASGGLMTLEEIGQG